MKKLTGIIAFLISLGAYADITTNIVCELEGRRVVSDSFRIIYEEEVSVETNINITINGQDRNFNYFSGINYQGSNSAFGSTRNSHFRFKPLIELAYGDDSSLSVEVTLKALRLYDRSGAELSEITEVRSVSDSFQFNVQDGLVGEQFKTVLPGVFVSHSSMGYDLIMNPTLRCSFVQQETWH